MFCFSRTIIPVATLLTLPLLVTAGCEVEETGCATDRDCRYDRICHNRLQICVDPDRPIPTEPDDTGTSDDLGFGDTGLLTDIGNAEVVFEDDFEDGNLDGWTRERSSRTASFDDSVVVFEGSNGSGRHDSKAKWARKVAIENPEAVVLQGRLKMGLDRRNRDQRIAIQFHLQTSDGESLGTISFYTRWEGRNGTLADKCRADSGRGWCTYQGQNPWVKEDATEFYRDVRARNRWRTFSRSLGDILRSGLTGIPASRIGRIEVRIQSTGAWGTNSRGLFDYVRILQQR
ncbi:MAG: hypothetical protein ABEN55_00860 [Bradymonadaceae bacterium]